MRWYEIFHTVLNFDATPPTQRKTLRIHRANQISCAEFRHAMRRAFKSLNQDLARHPDWHNPLDLSTLCLTKPALESVVSGEEEWFVSGVNMCFDVDFSEEEAEGEGKREGLGSAFSSGSGVFSTLQVNETSTLSLRLIFNFCDTLRQPTPNPRIYRTDDTHQPAATEHQRQLQPPQPAVVR